MWDTLSRTGKKNTSGQPRQTSQNVHPATPRAQTRCLPGCLAPVGGQAKTLRKPVLQSTQALRSTDPINAALTLPCQMNREDSARALGRAARKVAVFLLSSIRPLRLPKQPTVSDPLLQRLLGTCAPSGAWQLPVQHCHFLQPSSWRFRPCAEGKPKCKETPSDTTSSRRPSTMGNPSHIKLAATSAGAHGQGKGQMQQEKTERLSERPSE